jgi:hypothetical protein
MLEKFVFFAQFQTPTEHRNRTRRPDNVTDAFQMHLQDGIDKTGGFAMLYLTKTVV